MFDVRRDDAGHDDPARNALRVALSVLACVALLTPVTGQSQTGAARARPRTIVTTDPELDDSNSLVRFLRYAADVQTEGLIYASSQFHWKGDGKGTLFSVPNREYSRGGVNLCPCTSWRWKPGERHIDDAVDIYAAVYPNLKVHDPNYPTPEVLRSKIREGNVEFDGDTSKDTPGSTLVETSCWTTSGAPSISWRGADRARLRAPSRRSRRNERRPTCRRSSRRYPGKPSSRPLGDQDGTYVAHQDGMARHRIPSDVDGDMGLRRPGVVWPEFAQYLSAA